MRTKLRGKVTLLFMMLGMLIAIPAVALAAELVTSELDTVTPNDVTVEQGGTTNFNIGLTATGAIASTITSANPSTATVDTAYSLNNTGAVSGSTPSSAFKFFSSGTGCGGQNCDVTWTGAPTPYSVGASVSAASTTPVGDYSLVLSDSANTTDLTNPTATGGKLGDTNATTIKVHVVAPPPSDTTAPTIDYTLDPASPDGANGWYKSDVSLTWTVTENESASSLQTTGCEDQNIISDQQETTYSCSATSDGGSAGPVDVKIKRDATNPNVSLNGGPADGQSYFFGDTPAAPTCDASDDLSGLDGACSVSGYSSAVGTHTVTATATDNAGNENTASSTYTVKPYTLNGFYQPIDMNDTVNTVKNGSTVPVKFELFKGATELTSTSAVTSIKSTPISCASLSGDPEDAIETVATGGTSLRYDTTAGQFIYNWTTPKGATQVGKCYSLTMTAADSSTITALFKLK
jgi:hypothetical protein